MSYEVGAKLLEVFGLKGQHVFGLDLHAEIGEPPTLTIKRRITGPGEIHAVEQVFDLVLRGERIGFEKRDNLAPWERWLEQRAVEVHKHVADEFARVRAYRMEVFDDLISAATMRRVAWDHKLRVDMRNELLRAAGLLDA